MGRGISAINQSVCQPLEYSWSAPGAPYSGSRVKCVGVALQDSRAGAEASLQSQLAAQQVATRELTVRLEASQRQVGCALSQPDSPGVV